MHGKHINQPVLWGNDVNMIQFDGKAILWLYIYIFYLNGNEMKAANLAQDPLLRRMTFYVIMSIIFDSHNNLLPQ